MRQLRLLQVFAAGLALMSAPAGATPPRIDAEQCKEMRGEQTKFVESGILADLARGPDWAKANLTAEKLRQIELFIMLDEQLKFGCRDAQISADAARAGEAAAELEKYAPAAGPNASDAAGGSAGAAQASPDAAESAAKPTKKRKPVTVEKDEKPKRAKRKAPADGQASTTTP